MDSSNDTNKPILGPDMGYTEMLDYYTTEHQEKAIADGTNWQKTPLRPSAAGECARALAYSLEDFWGIKKHTVEIKEPSVVRLLDIGHSVEWHLINHIKRYLKEVFQVRYEQQVLSFTELISTVDPKRTQWVEGSIDFTLSSKEFKAVCDAKSKKEKYSSYRDSSWAEDNEKYERLPSVTKLGEGSFYVENIEQFLDEVRDPFLAMNIYQINLYASNQFLKERGFDHCSLWYYNKNTSVLRELRFKPSEALAEYVLDKFRTVFTLVDAGRTEEVPREFTPPSIKCAFCTYKETCWPEDDALRMYFKSLPPKEWPTDVSRLEAAEEIVELFEEYLGLEDAEKAVANLEEDICKLLVAEEVRKVKMPNGDVFEVRWYKTPREGFRLKRSKK